MWDLWKAKQKKKQIKEEKKNLSFPKQQSWTKVGNRNTAI